MPVSEHHVPVLLREVLDYLEIKKDGTYVDCTAGAGGHSESIARCLTGGRLIAIDCDEDAVRLATERLKKYDQAQVVRGNYSELSDILAGLGIATVEGVLIDAGVSSMQLDTPLRGFSFQREGPLDMRMDTDAEETAEAYLATINDAELARILRENGDLSRSKRIASAICTRRDGGRMKTTQDLAAAVSEAFPFVEGVPEEVRTVFQAIRMEVNRELPRLEAGLHQAIDVLGPEGRLVVIAFHSGEDRIAKRVLREASRKQERRSPDGRILETIPPVLKRLTRKPVCASEDEIRANPRSRPARLRAAEKCVPEDARS